MFRAQFIKSLIPHFKEDRNLMILTADLGYRLFDDLIQACPNQFINMGVAEANMMSVAAGMALCGKNVFVYSMVPFVTCRALDSVRVDVCGHNATVKIVGVGAGVGYGLEGMTHFAIEDLSWMQAFPNLKIVCPADQAELQALLPAVIAEPGPVYIRLIKGNAESVHGCDSMGLPELQERQLGPAICVRRGRNVALLSFGSGVAIALQAANLLQRLRIDASVYSFPTLKPLSLATLTEVVESHDNVFTVEEHSLQGGFGAMVAHALLGLNFTGHFRSVGFPNRYPIEIGHGPYLCDQAGITPHGLSAVVEATLNQSKNGRQPQNSDLTAATVMRE